MPEEILESQAPVQEPLQVHVSANEAVYEPGTEIELDYGSDRGSQPKMSSPTSPASPDSVASVMVLSPIPPPPTPPPLPRAPTPCTKKSPGRKSAEKKSPGLKAPDLMSSDLMSPEKKPVEKKVPEKQAPESKTEKEGESKSDEKMEAVVEKSAGDKVVGDKADGDKPEGDMPMDLSSKAEKDKSVTFDQSIVDKPETGILLSPSYICKHCSCTITLCKCIRPFANRGSVIKFLGRLFFVVVVVSDFRVDATREDAK